jgi:curved DNA-binding protein CbpA
VKAKQVLNFEAGEALTAAAVNKRRRELARIYHPDRPNGSKEAMQRINEAADDLLANLA